MIAQILKNDRGIALVVTIAVVTLLIAAALELNRKTRSGVMLSAASRDRLTLSYIASSGIHIGMAMLMKDKKDDLKLPSGKAVDTVNEDWNNPEAIEEVLADFPFEEGGFTIKISDELGKIQVNALVDYPKGRNFNTAQQQLWDRFLRPIVSLDEDAEINATKNIVDSLKDWLDLGDDDAITGLNGAESDYYLGLDPPYSSRNGPLTHLGELLMVKDVKSEYFDEVAESSLQSLGGGSGLSSMLDTLGIPYPDNIDDLTLEDLGISTRISDFMTVYGMTHEDDKSKWVDGRSFKYDGKININTADIPVIATMLEPPPGLPAESVYVLAAAISEYRAEIPEESTIQRDFSNKNWYKDVSGITNSITMPDGKNKNINVTIKPDLITTTSDFFRIEATASLNELENTIVAVVHREEIDKKNSLTKKWRCRVLSWESK
jgi:general secretion pathway protein K